MIPIDEKSCCQLARNSESVGCECNSQTSIHTTGVQNPHVLDALIYNEKEDKIFLVMYENRPWNDHPEQLLQLQEKFNAYASFILDGEFHETFPQLAGKPTCIQLRTFYEPSPIAQNFLDYTSQQLRLMDIDVEVWLIGET
ncbi:MAG: hypothetical protein NZL93_04690 [Chthoniobacterales bacterium]|nr:hypothetical protein [Chthoniobacterales bacterium]